MNTKMSNDKINLINDEISQATEAVHQNISLVIDRGEKLDNLVEKSEHLNHNSALFKKQAKKLKWRMFMKKLKMTALLMLIIFLIIMLFLFMICGWGLHCGK